MTLTLGLDLGPSSIGWALTRPDGLVDIGVRVFQEGLDNFDSSKEASRNEQRRRARGQRRQHRRAAERLRRLRHALVGCGLFPADEADQELLIAIDPWPLRARGADENAAPLTAHEFGRVLLHLTQRRGFLSNRKKPRLEKDEEGLLGEIEQLRQHVAIVAEDKKRPTLGQFLAARAERFTHGRDAAENFAHADDPGDANDPAGPRVRRRHLHREMVEAEFDRLWTRHAAAHPNLLTDELRDGRLGRRPYPAKPEHRPRDLTRVEAFGIHGLIFLHRQLYWPASSIGRCELEPSEPRALRADRRVERFRVLQDINDLRVVNPATGQEQALDPEQRAYLLDKLSASTAVAFEALRKTPLFAPDAQFSLEKGKRSKLLGSRTDALLAAAAALGPGWRKRTEEQKDAIVAVLAEPTRDDMEAEPKLRRLGLTEAEADRALAVDLPEGRSNVSLLAIQKMLPFLEQGLPLSSTESGESARSKAGYAAYGAIRGKKYGLLPDPQRLPPGERPLPDLPNPVVRRTIVELRKVVNAIIRAHGRPDQIHVEMARSLRQGPKARSETLQRNKERAGDREASATALRSNGLKPSRDAILKHRLWESQENRCAYCPRTFGFAEAMNGDGLAEVDHILPYSRTLDDAQTNKVFCCTACNREKGKQSPFEWFGKGERFDLFLDGLQRGVRAGRIPYSKLRKGAAKKIDTDGFLARHLTDTGYLSRVAVGYLNCLYNEEERKKNPVQGRKGELTSELRYQWAIHNLLEDLPDSPAWTANLDAPAGAKNRADHRHHAIDAVVVALTNRKRLQQLTGIRKRGGVLKTGEALPEPWLGFRDELLERLNAVRVSHRASRGLRGALHEETSYGPVRDPST